VINADAQNLGVGSGVLGLRGLERLDLVRSDRRPCQRKESQHDILAAQLAQIDLAAEVRWECEDRHRLSEL
jgi:hypothetical protein